MAFIALALVPLATLVHLLVGGPGASVAHLLLQYTLLFPVGLMGLYFAAGHWFNSRLVAEHIGWPAENPFQLELGYANLAVAALGLLALWVRGSFWLAPIVAVSLFYWGAFAVHVAEKRKGNHHPGNAGWVLPYDLALPALL
jgi:hypothetical protein